jgi:hypothetical protein
MPRSYFSSPHQSFPYFSFSVCFFQVVEIIAYDYMGDVKVGFAQSLPHQRLFV